MGKLFGLADHPAARIIAAAFALIGALSAVGWLAEKLQRPLSKLFVDTPAGAPAGDSVILAYWLVFFGLTAVFVALIAVIIDIALLRRLMVTGIKTQARLTEEYSRLCDSIRRIVYQTYNPSNPNKEPAPRFQFKTILCLFEIQSNGDTKVEQHYTIYTAGNPAHFWTVRIVSDDFAVPMETLRDIDFEVVSVTPDWLLEAVPLDNRGFERSIALFFLPEIPPQSTRSFEVQYRWCGWFGELFSDRRSTNWPWSYQSMDPNDTADVTFRFTFARGCGPILCENLKSRLPGDQLTMSAAGGGTVWEYRNTSAPVGRLKWELKFSRAN